MKPDFLYYKTQFIDNHLRIQTPPPLQQSAVSDIPPESTPLDNITVRQRKKVVATHKSKPGFLTPLGTNLAKAQLAFSPHTVPTSSRAGDFMPNICTPQSTPTGKAKPEGTPEVPEPYIA